MLTNNAFFPAIPDLIPFPSRTEGAVQPVICLDGAWDFHAVPEDAVAGRTPEEWGAALLGQISWTRQVAVPSSMDFRRMEGFTGYSLCRRVVSLPGGVPARARLALRFEAVNARAALFVNGRFVRAHENGFIAWTADITDWARGGDFELVLALDDRQERVSTYNRGGILHSVSLLILPEAYIRALRTVAEPEPSLQTGRMRADVRACPGADRASLRLTLLDARGEAVPRGVAEAPLQATMALALSGLPVALWDAEHPRLYTLRAEIVSEDGAVLEATEQQVGFRRIERRGNRVYVNGREIKLRGTCRHEVTALHGRATDRATIEADVRLFKAANINYVRTSHYPPTEYFLELCDRFGIYVEDELALAFIARTLDYTQQDPAFTQRYLSHFAETFARDNHHPSVILWSLCNESFGGVNFDLLNRFAKATDPTRLTKFSYPMTIREEYAPVDVWSIHYGEWDLDPSVLRDNVSVGGAYRHDLPVIHDEYVHVPCYDREEMRRDPYVNVFWGQSIARFWDSIWRTPGALGGAIWAGIDETDVYVGGGVKLEWGIIDIHRREKPEHFMTRKAYSPIRVHGEPRALEGRLCLAVENRFCHTPLSEVTVRGGFIGAGALTDASVEDCRRAVREAFCVTGPAVEPFETGKLSLPAPPAGAEKVFLEFADACGQVVDEYLLSVCAARAPADAIPSTAPEWTVQEDDAAWRFTARANGGRIDYAFDKASGAIDCVAVNGVPMIVGGPELHVPKLRPAPWRLGELRVLRDAEGWTLFASGGHGDALALTWRYRLCARTGELTIALRVDGAGVRMPTSRKLRVGTDCGGLDEYGFSLVAAGGQDRLSWRGSGEYSVCPSDFIARGRGCAALTLGGGSAAENAAAGIPWKDDNRHDLLNGLYDPGLKGSNDFTSLKANLERARLGGIGLRPAREGTVHLRAEALPVPERVIACTDPSLSYSGRWYDMDDPSAAPFHAADCRGTAERWSKDRGSTVTCRFRGTGIVWYGPVDVNYGKAAVYLDGQRAAVVNQRVDGVDFPGSAAGFDKKYHFPVFSVDHLPDGEHALTIEVLDECAPDSADSYVVIESFYVLRPDDRPPVRLNLLRDYNFPQISWGNRRKAPVVMREGDVMAVTLYFPDAFP